MKSFWQWGREIKWAWQRVFRGWDDTVVWSIDMHLNVMLPQWLRVLRDNGMGVPCGMSETEWHDILNRMIAGFEAGKRLDEWKWSDNDEWKQLESQLDEALKLLVEYYRALWD